MTPMQLIFLPGKFIDSILEKLKFNKKKAVSMKLSTELDKYNRN